MSGEAVYLLASLLLAYLVYVLVTRGGRGVLWYWWRRGRVAGEVWWARADGGAGGRDRRPEHAGVLGASAYEREMEQPKPFVTDRHEDVMSVCGVDSEGRAVVIRAARLSRRRASLFVSVTDKDGTVYTLPNQPDTSQVNVEGDGWGGAGLTLTCVDPMRLWRVKFNGLLRRGTREEYITEGEKRTGENEQEEEEEEEGEIVHARLHFLWCALRGPIEAWAVVSPRLLSRALAPHPNALPRDYLEEERDHYEQWGSLHGTVQLQDGASIDTWYLRGPRRHRWGLADAVGRGLSTCVYFKNGDVFSLRAHSPVASGPQYMNGYLNKASGHVHPVTWCDLDLNKLDKLDQLGHNLLIKFKAGGQTYEAWQRLGPAVTYYTGDPWTCGHALHAATTAASHSHGHALTTLSFRYTALCPVPERESLPRVEVPQGLEGSGVPLVVTLEDPRCRNTGLAGGKGASLAMLTAYRELLDPDQQPYEVPPGVVVTSRAWELQLAACPDLQQAIRNLRLASAAGQAARLKEACLRAVEVCKTVEICAEVTEALLTCLAEMINPETTRLAVRSSGCVEDGSEASAAGQNETVLGVVGRGELLAAVTTCWASLFTYQSVEYRRQRGQPMESGMGVVGVVFTVDPATGDPSTITITANYGLGESVVSAGAEPDTVVVKRSWRDTLKVHRRSVGGKAVKCVLKEGGGTQEVALEEEARGKVCISDRAALRVARVALFLHHAFAGPRDIEFALLKSEAVVVLQARPITSLHAWTEYEMMHDLDTATLTDEDPITKGNTGEVFPGSTSPLSLSVVGKILNLAFQEQNYIQDRHQNYLCPSYYTHVFINVIETMYRNMEEEEAGMLVFQALDMAVFGHHTTTQAMLRHARERFGVSSMWRKLSLSLRIVYDRMSTGMARVRRYQDKYKDFKVGQGKTVGAAALYAEITRRFPDLLEVTNAHMRTSKVASFCLTIAFMMLADGRKELSQENVADMAVLLSSCTGTESAEVPSALKELSRVISESEEAEEFLAMSPDEAHVWLRSHPGPVGAVFRQFLSRHGHRSLKELDLYSLSWRVNPHSLLTTLQVMTRYPTGDTRAPRPPVDRDELLDQFSSPMSRGTRRALRFMVPKCQESVVLREATKSLLIRVIDGLRIGYRELGMALVSEGRLPNPDLVFFLTHSELGQLVSVPSPSLVMKAVGKARLYPHLDNLRFQELSLGTPHPMQEREEGERSKEAGAGVELVGSPVFQGTVKGTARVVTRLQDAETIQSGDILVTVCTDIGWSPYFPLLSGVVTELGGLFSHGAVVAREYGLPCLVGVVGATGALRSGDKVLLDSIRGTLTLLQSSSSSSLSSSDK
ncbi:hypothetical protein O3P69_014516 [Scylla paramamosain]|uniref:Phosphoenolpyruvate synthase n=1 Tax=Scylla paramamosain TaxID=85552 RepID=A0AAW0TCA9_SCYPA